MLENKLNFSTSWSFQRLKIISANERVFTSTVPLLCHFKCKQIHHLPEVSNIWEKLTLGYFSPVLSVLLNKSKPLLGKTIPFWENNISYLTFFRNSRYFLKKTLIITTSLEKYRFFFGVEDSREFIIFLRYSSIIKGNNIKE